MRVLSPTSGTLLLAATVFISTATGAYAQGLRPRDGDLKVGDPAPDFTVSDLEGKNTVTLSSLKGKPVTLIFGSCT